MSEQNNPKPIGRAWHFYLDDIIGFAGNVLAYTANLSQAAFEQSQLHSDATVRPQNRPQHDRTQILFGCSINRVREGEAQTVQAYWRSEADKVIV